MKTRQDHPLWFLARGGIPVPATAKRAPKDVAWFCREGDERWRPIEELANQQPATESAET
jgi:hypothetical protein